MFLLTYFAISCCCNYIAMTAFTNYSSTPAFLILRELLGLEPVSLMIKKSRLRWFVRVEHEEDNDWVKRCMTWEVEGIRQRGRPWKTWWDCVKDDMENLDLSRKVAQFRNKRNRRIKGNWQTQGSAWKNGRYNGMCVCACVCACERPRRSGNRTKSTSVVLGHSPGGSLRTKLPEAVGRHLE